jgi:hypothetical protein
MLGSWYLVTLLFFAMVFENQLQGQTETLGEASSESTQIPDDTLSSNQEPLTEIWRHYILDYRENHHVSLLGLFGSSDFALKSFGSLRSRTLRKDFAGTRFGYAYHIPIFRKFGYLLGSQFGLNQYIGKADRFEVEDIVIVFPGLTFGLDYNFDSQWRLLGFFSINLERFDRITETDPGLDENNNSRTTISTTMYGFDQALALDYFFAMRWALRWEAHYKRLYYERPKNPQGYELNANIKALETWYGVGFSYHLL